MQTGIYRHHKGGYYLVLGIGAHTETEEILVAYVALTGIHMPGPRLRFRPLEGLEGWNTPVRHLLGPSEGVPRFVYCGDELGDNERPSELPQTFETKQGQSGDRVETFGPKVGRLSSRQSNLPACDKYTEHPTYTGKGCAMCGQPKSAHANHLDPKNHPFIPSPTDLLCAQCGARRQYHVN